MLTRLEKILTSIEENIIFISIISSLLVVFVNIILRYVFSKGFVFSEEYARYAMVLLVYVGVSQSIKKGSMIRVDIVSSFMPKASLVMNLISNVFSLVVAVILILYGYKFTVWQYSTGQKSIAMELPLWIAYAVVPIGGVLMLLRYSTSTIGIITKALRVNQSQ